MSRFDWRYFVISLALAFTALFFMLKNNAVNILFICIALLVFVLGTCSSVRDYMQENLERNQRRRSFLLHIVRDKNVYLSAALSVVMVSFRNGVDQTTSTSKEIFFLVSLTSVFVVLISLNAAILRGIYHILRNKKKQAEGKALR